MRCLTSSIPSLSGKHPVDRHPWQSKSPSKSGKNSSTADSALIDQKLAKLAKAKEDLIAKARRLVA